MSQSPSFLASSEPQRPIFILSCYRTGSTLLRYILDTHPEVYGPPEIYTGQTALNLARFAAGLAGSKFNWEQPEATPPEILDWIRTVLGDAIRRATASKGKRLWCEKTPSNLSRPHLLLLDSLFPQARYICLHRHCLDVAQSLVTMGWPEEIQPFLSASEGRVVQAIVDYWCKRTFTALSFEFENPSRCFRLRYEDLVSDPEKTLEPLFAFLGLAWDRGLLEAVFSARHDPGEGDHYIQFTTSIHTRSVGAGASLPLADVPGKTLRAMRSLLSALDYPEIPSSLAAPESAEGSQREASDHALDLQWLFETYLPQRLRAGRPQASVLRASYQFVVRGEGGGSWVIYPQEGKVATGRAAAACQIEVAATDLLKIARGELHPVKAAEQGKLQIRGNAEIGEFQSLAQLFQIGSLAALSEVGRWCALEDSNL
jgi:protein-tyrosine sulfotransferase